MDDTVTSDATGYDYRFVGFRRQKPLAVLPFKHQLQACGDHHHFVTIGETIPVIPGLRLEADHYRSIVMPIDSAAKLSLEIYPNRHTVDVQTVSEIQIGGLEIVVSHRPDLATDALPASS